MSERSFFAGDDHEPDVNSIVYQKHADTLLYNLLVKTNPRGRPRPPSREQGRQTLELEVDENLWQAIGLIALPCKNWPNVHKPEIVGMIQFCEPFFPESSLQAIHYVGLVAHPTQIVEVRRGLMIIDSQSTANWSGKIKMDRLNAQKVGEINTMIASAEPKQIELY